MLAKTVAYDSQNYAGTLGSGLSNTIYRTSTKFRGINFCALAGSEFRGSIFSCGVIFIDTQCSTRCPRS